MLFVSINSLPTFSLPIFTKKIFQEYDQSETVWSEICVKTVCKGYRQNTLVGKELKVVFWVIQ